MRKASAAVLIIVLSQLGLSACDDQDGGAATSADDQIRKVTADFTAALNAADADRVNALTCTELREKRPATTVELQRSLDTYGAYTAEVSTIDLDGDKANVQVTLQASKDAQPGTMSIRYVREDGEWKRCNG